MYLAVNDEAIVFETDNVVAVEKIESSRPKTRVYLNNDTKFVVWASIADVLSVLGWKAPGSDLNDYVVLENSNSQYQ